jgi:hypothetical protein
MLLSERLVLRKDSLDKRPKVHTDKTSTNKKDPLSNKMFQGWASFRYKLKSFSFFESSM